MELPKNITQIGETNPHCKIYVEDYVISYIKQLNQHAGEKEMAVALYGTRKEEAGVTYLFLYGASRLVFLQKECRHLSQAVQQEAEKQRKKYFPDLCFLGYRMLDGEMVEGFHICEQGVCRCVEGYAQFYEKNDAMLAFMLEERQEAVKPETVDQEKYNVVKRRQEERRALAGEKGGHAVWARRRQSWQQARTSDRGPVQETSSGAAQEPGQSSASEGNPVVAAPRSGMRGMKLTAAAVFVLLCVSGLAVMGGGENAEGWQMAVRQLMENMSEKQLPDVVQVSGSSAQVGTIVAEDKLTDAILQENAAADSDVNQPGAAGQGSGQEGQGAGQDQAASQNSAQNQGQGTGQNTGQGTVPDPSQNANQGTAQNPSQGTSQGAAQNPSQDAGQGAGQNPSQNASQGTVQNPSQDGSQGSAQASGQEADQNTAQDAGQDLDQNPDQSADQPADQESVPQPDTKPAAGPTAELVSYTVQRGDTLIGICVKRYGTDARVSEICSLNNIQDPDDIKVGEKIFLPQ